MSLSRNKKNNEYPCKPQFYYIKVGFKGGQIYRYVFVMQPDISKFFPIYSVGSLFSLKWVVNQTESVDFFSLVCSLCPKDLFRAYQLVYSVNTIPK